MQTTSFGHRGTIGDTWASIPAMREYTKKTGKRVILYLEKDYPAEYYKGAVHPTKNEKGEMVTLNQSMIDMMIPLFKVQPFIEDCKVWEGEKIDIDLNKIRESYVGMPGLSINRWYFYVYPDLSCDLSGVWLNVPENEKNLAKGKIIITRSERYNIDNADFSFLKPYEDDLLFCGTMREYNNFCMRFDLNIRKFAISNFLELAQAIKQCKFHVTNQTQAFQLSEGQKTPRILEVCGVAPNCIPIGANAYDFLKTEHLEYHFHTLNGSLEGYAAKYKQENPAVMAG